MIAFDDSGAPILATDPVIGMQDDAPPENRMEATEAIRALLGYLVEPGEAVESGRRCLVLGHLLRLPGSPVTVRELAEVLGLPLATAWRLKQRIEQTTRKPGCFLV